VSAQDSDLILSQARQSLANQRAGGRQTRSIGSSSAALKRGHVMRKLVRIAAAVVAIMFAAVVAGLVLDGIGWTGIILTLLAMIAAVGVFARFPRLDVPQRASLTGGDVKSLVGRTELWLEAQRPALPAPAIMLVDQIGLQLDALGQQLHGLDENQPAVAQVRKLVGADLPDLVSAFTNIPPHLRAEAVSGRSPDAQLTESLGKISGEIDSVTRQLASGAIDKLAIQTRYLDYKYGDALEGKAKS
jgi:hypothetical protein